MASRQLKLTTIGLPVRAELRIKSLLPLVSKSVSDRWTIVDHDSADLALCQPESALSQVLVQRALSDGRPHCVMLVGADSSPIDGDAIRDPIRPSDLIELLNRVAGSVKSGSDNSRSAQSGLAHTLREVLGGTSGEVLEMRARDIQLYVIPSARVVLCGEALSENRIRAISGFDIDVNVVGLSHDVSTELPVVGGHSYSADQLLWQLGVFGPRQVIAPHLDESSDFRLLRWPDFGICDHDSLHLRLAACLTRRWTSIDELVSTFGATRDQVVPFINACEYCDLLGAEFSSETKPANVPGRRAAVGAGVIRALRFALGIGGARQ